jgi:hypothetical protein
MGKAMFLKLRDGVFIDSSDVVSVNFILGYEEQYKVIVRGSVAGLIELEQADEGSARCVADAIGEAVLKARECQR